MNFSRCYIQKFSILALGLSSAAMANSAYEPKLFQSLGAFESIRQKLKLESSVADQIDGLDKDGRIEILGKVVGDQVETTKARYFYKGLPVLGATAMVHTSTNGEEIVTTTVPKLNISAEPTITTKQAVAITQSLSKNPLSALPELKILPNGDNLSARLIYSVRQRDDSKGAGGTTLIDAHTGEVIAQISNHEEIAPIQIYSARNLGIGLQNIVDIPPGTLFPRTVACELVDIAGSRKGQLELSKCDAFLAQNMNPTKGCQLISMTDGSPMVVFPKGCKPIVNGGRWVSPGPDISGTNAFENAKKVLNYYLSRHNRDSFDGRGGELVATVQVGSQFDNAYWNTEENHMVYGTGDGIEMGDFSRYVDIAGHEMTHGVVSKTAGFISIDETGALNEAISDFFGKMIEGKRSWKVGQGIFLRDPARALRDHEFPNSVKHRFIDPNGARIEVPMPKHVREKLLAFGGGAMGAAACTAANDRCYVHGNATIPGHAFFQMVKRIGEERAEKVIYLALTQFMNERTDFRGAAVALKTACSRIYDPSTCGQVNDSLAVVGL